MARAAAPPEVVTMLLDQAIEELDQGLPDGDRAEADLVHRLTTVRAALLAEPVRSRDGWLAARARCADRDRRRLAARLAALAERLRERPRNELTAVELRRLRVDLEHYRQRLSDLAYDTVGLELGGSE